MCEKCWSDENGVPVVCMCETSDFGDHQCLCIHGSFCEHCKHYPANYPRGQQASATASPAVEGSTPGMATPTATATPTGTPSPGW
jgi:hypothetical protein